MAEPVKFTWDIANNRIVVEYDDATSETYTEADGDLYALKFPARAQADYRAMAKRSWAVPRLSAQQQRALDEQAAILRRERGL